MARFELHLDPRKIYVLVDLEAGHLEKHYTDLQGQLREHLVETICSPDRIVSNQSHRDPPGRRGNERYVRFDARLERFINVPVKNCEESEMVPGYGIVSGDTRLVLTCYPSKELNVRSRAIWVKA